MFDPKRGTKHRNGTETVEPVQLIRSLVRNELNVLTQARFAGVCNQLRSEIVTHTQDWLDCKAIRVAVSEHYRHQRNQIVDTTSSSQKTPTETDLSAQAECAKREASELFTTQVECVKFLLEGGRTPD